MNHKPENSHQAVALIKFFSEKDHYLAFKSGYSIFRTPHFYRTLENIGRGDRNESCFGYWDRNLGDGLPNLINNGDPVDLSDALSLLIYPLQERRDAWMQSWSYIGPFNNFYESLERMLLEFGAYFVILPATNIGAYAKLISEATGLDVRFGAMKYSDRPRDRSLGVKDSRFKYQEELRFYLGECDKGEIQDKEIQLQGLGDLLLEAPSLKIEHSSGGIKYCSLGRKEVVTA